MLSSVLHTRLPGLTAWDSKLGLADILVYDIAYAELLLLLLPHQLHTLVNKNVLFLEERIKGIGIFATHKVWWKPKHWFIAAVGTASLFCTPYPLTTHSEFYASQTIASYHCAEQLWKHKNSLSFPQHHTVRDDAVKQMNTGCSVGCEGNLTGSWSDGWFAESFTNNWLPAGCEGSKFKLWTRCIVS